MSASESEDSRVAILEAQLREEKERRERAEKLTECAERNLRSLRGAKEATELLVAVLKHQLEEQRTEIKDLCERNKSLYYDARALRAEFQAMEERRSFVTSSPISADRPNSRTSGSSVETPESPDTVAPQAKKLKRRKTFERIGSFLRTKVIRRGKLPEKWNADSTLTAVM